ncbi:MAG: trypsin-like peptidase domain-containing protein [Bacillota bacterium]
MKITKKLSIIMLILVLSLSLVLVGCSTEELDSYSSDTGRVTDDDTSSTDSSSSSSSSTENNDVGSSVVIESVSVGTTSDLVTTIAEVRDSVVDITSTLSSGTSMGSGVIISVSDNYAYIVTCNHVVEDAQSIYITNTSGDSYTATFVGGLGDQDVAVLRIAAYSDICVATIRSLDDAPLQLGEDTIIIGNPLGTLGGSISTGIVSGLERYVSVNNTTLELIQTDAAINSGNSGGGMFDSNGSLIGIINAKASGDSVDNIGFAIPIDSVIEIASSIITTANDSSNAYGGLGYMEGKFLLDITTSTYTENYTNYYLYVSEVSEYGCAYGQLEVGDYIYSINGYTVTETTSIDAILSSLSIGDTVTISLIRLTTTYTGFWGNQQTTTQEDLTVTITLTQYVYGYIA